MRKTMNVMAIGLLTANVLLATSASAAPSNGDVIDFVCGDSAVHVMLSPGGGNKSWSVDEARASDGTTFHVKTFEIRIYPGAPTTEPTEQPTFSWSSSYGRRVGQGEPVECNGSRPVGSGYTAFLTVGATVRS